MSDERNEGAEGEALPSVAHARVMDGSLHPERLDEVERRLLAAQSPRRVEVECAALWGITKRTARRYVTIVRRRLAKHAASRDPSVDGEIAREMLLDAFATAKAGGDHGPNAGAMVQAARAYAEITGAAQPQRVDITSGGKAIRTMTDDELLAEARRLAAIEADGDEPRATH